MEKLAHDPSEKLIGSRYPLDPTVEAVEVLLTTGGMPMNARIEILQGPDTNKQAGPGTHTEELVSHTSYRYNVASMVTGASFVQFCYQKVRLI